MINHKEDPTVPKVFFLVGTELDKSRASELPGQCGIITTTYTSELSKEALNDCFRISGHCYKELGIVTFLIARAELVDVLLSSKEINNIPVIVPNNNFTNVLKIDLKGNSLNVYTTEENKNFAITQEMHDAFMEGCNDELISLGEWKSLDTSPLEHPEGS